MAKISGVASALKILPGLVNIQKAIENGHRNSGFSHEIWWFSVVFCMFTRPGNIHLNNPTSWKSNQRTVWQGITVSHQPKLPETHVHDVPWPGNQQEYDPHNWECHQLTKKKAPTWVNYSQLGRQSSNSCERKRKQPEKLDFTHQSKHSNFLFAAKKKHIGAPIHADLPRLCLSQLHPLAQGWVVAEAWRNLPAVRHGGGIHLAIK